MTLLFFSLSGNIIWPYSLPMLPGFALLFAEVWQHAGLPQRDRFMKGLYNWVGFTRLGLETHTNARRAGCSSFNFKRLLDLGLTGLTSFSTMPLRIWTVIGSMISLLAIGYAIYEVYRTLVYGNPLPGWPTLAVAVTFLGGIQLLSIGILGEYVGRIFDEVKQRPSYLVSRIVSPADKENAVRHET